MRQRGAVMAMALRAVGRQGRWRGTQVVYLCDALLELLMEVGCGGQGATLQ